MIRACSPSWLKSDAMMVKGVFPYIAKRFIVSTAAMTHRLANLGLIR